MVDVINRNMTVSVTCKTCQSGLKVYESDIIRKNTIPPTYSIQCPACYSPVSLTCADGIDAIISKDIHMGMQTDPRGTLMASTAYQIYGERFLLLCGHGKKEDK